jgi:hypothetical protein
MSESSQLNNNEYNILKALGMEAQFIHETINTYRKDAQNENRNDLVDVWEQIKSDREKHIIMLKEKLKEFYK